MAGIEGGDTPSINKLKETIGQALDDSAGKIDTGTIRGRRVKESAAEQRDLLVNQVFTKALDEKGIDESKFSKAASLYEQKEKIGGLLKGVRKHFINKKIKKLIGGKFDTVSQTIVQTAKQRLKEALAEQREGTPMFDVQGKPKVPDAKFDQTAELTSEVSPDELPEASEGRMFGFEKPYTGEDD